MWRSEQSGGLQGEAMESWKVLGMQRWGRGGTEGGYVCVMGMWVWRGVFNHLEWFRAYYVTGT